MKKLMSVLLCLALLLSLTACGNSTTETTEATEATETTETTETTEEATEADTLPTEDTTVEESTNIELTIIPFSYGILIASAEEAVSSMEFNTVYHSFYDLDSNGIEELLLMYPATEDGKNIYACSLYTLTSKGADATAVALLENHTVYYNLAGGPDGSVGVATSDGTTFFYVRSNYADIKGYENESLNEESGKWEMYTLNGTELTLESNISFDLVYNNGNIATEGVWIQPDFAPEGKVLPELSTVTDNDQEIPMEVYAMRMDNLVILHDIRDAE